MSFLGFNEAPRGKRDANEHPYGKHTALQAEEREPDQAQRRAYRGNTHAKLKLQPQDKRTRIAPSNGIGLE